MKTRSSMAPVLAVLLLAGAAALAQDQVTIPRSRLQDLEAKEAELEKLKAQLGLKGVVAPQGGQPERASRREPESAQEVSPGRPVALPPFSSLPLFQAGGSVAAADLAGYYQQDRVSADLRFKNKRLVVEGEISGFSKPLLTRNYRVNLKGAERGTQVLCDVIPPENLDSVFTTGENSELVGLQGQTRIPLFKVGQRVRVGGTCRSLKGSSVFIEAREIRKLN